MPIDTAALLQRKRELLVRRKELLLGEEKGTDTDNEFSLVERPSKLKRLGRAFGRPALAAAKGISTLPDLLTNAMGRKGVGQYLEEITPEDWKPQNTAEEWLDLATEGVAGLPGVGLAGKAIQATKPFTKSHALGKIIEQGSKINAPNVGALAGSEIATHEYKKARPDAGNLEKMGIGLLGGLGGGLLPSALKGSSKMIGKGLAKTLGVMPEKLRSFNEAELPMNLGQVTKQTPLMRIQNILSYIPGSQGGQEKLRAAQEKQLIKLLQGEKAHGLTETTGPELLQKAGKQSLESINKTMKGYTEKLAPHMPESMNAEETEILKAILNKTKGGAQSAVESSVVPKTLKEKAQLIDVSEALNLLREGAQVVGSAAQDYLKSVPGRFLKTLEKIDVPLFGNKLPYKSLVAKIHELDKHIDYDVVGDKNQGLLKMVKGALENAKDNYVRNLSPEAAKLLTKKAKIYHRYAKDIKEPLNKLGAHKKELVKDELGNVVFEGGQKKYTYTAGEKEYQNYLSALKGKTIDEAKAVAKSLTDVQRQELGSLIIKDFGTKQGVFDPFHFRSQYLKLNSPARNHIKTLLHPELQKKFDHIMDAMGHMQEVLKHGNPSGTAPTQMWMRMGNKIATAVAGVAAGSGNPVVFGSIVLPLAGAKLMSSGIFLNKSMINLMDTGLKANSKQEMRSFMHELTKHGKVGNALLQSIMGVFRESQQQDKK